MLNPFEKYNRYDVAGMLLITKMYFNISTNADEELWLLNECNLLLNRSNPADI